MKDNLYSKKISDLFPNSDLKGLKYKISIIFGGVLFFLVLSIAFPLPFYDQLPFVVSVIFHWFNQLHIAIWVIQAGAMAIYSFGIINIGVTCIKWGAICIQFLIIEGIVDSFLCAIVIGPQAKRRNDYRSLSILVSIYNEVFADIFIMIKFVLVCISSGGFATAIFHRYEPICFPIFFFSVIATVGVLVIYQTGVSIQEASLNCIQKSKWELKQSNARHRKNGRQIKYVRRILLSFHSIKIRSGPFLYVNSGGTLKILNATLQWTMNTLLIFRAIWV